MAQVAEKLSQEHYLSTLTQAPANEVKEFVEDLLADLGEVAVLRNRTGLVMLPYTDTVQGTVFHLGEVLMAEAWVCVHSQDGTVSQEGYAACLGRDLTQALAIAVFDAAWQGDLIDCEEKLAPFVQAQALALALADETLLRKVETTRVEMETF